MPSYDYFCARNGRTVEVRHGMQESMTTWGEVCASAAIDLGDTPADSPVTRVISPVAGIVAGGGAGGSSTPFPAGGGCGHGGCGHCGH